MARRRRSKIGDFTSSQIATDRKPLDIAASSALVPAGLDREVLLQTMLMTRMGAFTLQLDEIAVFPLTRGAGEKMAQQHERRYTGIGGIVAGAGTTNFPVFDAWAPAMDGAAFLDSGTAGTKPGIRLYHEDLGSAPNVFDEYVQIDENNAFSVVATGGHVATMVLNAGACAINRATGAITLVQTACVDDLSAGKWKISACIIEGVHDPSSIRLNGVNKHSATDLNIPESEHTAPMYGMSSEVSWDEAKKLVYIEPTTNPLIDQTFTSQSFVLPAALNAEQIAIAVLVDPAHYTKDFLTIEAVTDPNFHKGLATDGSGTYGSPYLWSIENRTNVSHNTVTDYQGNTLLYTYGVSTVWTNGVVGPQPTHSESLMLRFTVAGQKGGGSNVDTGVGPSAVVGAHTYAAINETGPITDRDIMIQITGGLLPGVIKLANPLSAPVFSLSGFAGMVIDNAATIAASTMNEGVLNIVLVFPTHANVTGGSNWLITYYGIPRDVPVVVAGFGVGIK